MIDEEDEDIEEVTPPVTFAKPENTRTIEIDRFFPRAQIDARYFDKPYYVVPSGGPARDLENFSHLLWCKRCGRSARALRTIPGTFDHPANLKFSQSRYRVSGQSNRFISSRINRFSHPEMECGMECGMSMIEKRKSVVHTSP